MNCSPLFKKISESEAFRVAIWTLSTEAHATIRVSLRRARLLQVCLNNLAHAEDCSKRHGNPGPPIPRSARAATGLRSCRLAAEANGVYHDGEVGF